jgi:O-antigen/teichoic acid export membrane protein
MSEGTDGFETIFTAGWVLFVGFALELLISLVGKILIARYLGKVDYGGVALGVTMLAMTSTVVLAGIHTGVGRYLPRFDQQADQDGLIGGAVLIVGTLSVIATLSIIISAEWIATTVFGNPELFYLVVIFSLAVPASAIMRLTIGITQGYQLSFPKVIIRNLTFPITRLIGIGIVIVVGVGSVGIASAYVVAYVAAACIGLFCIYNYTNTGVSLPNISHTRELLSFSAPLFITGALSLVLSDVDTLMLGILSTQADVGVYNVVYPTAILLLVFLRSFRFIYMPRISELDSSNQSEGIRLNYRLITKWLFFTTTPILVAFTVRPRYIISLLYGSEYSSGGLVLTILAVGFYLHSVLGLNGTTLTSLGHTRVILYINVAAAVFNIALNLTLIPIYSLVGAAVATMLSYIFINVLYSAILYRITGIIPIQKSVVYFSILILPLVILINLSANSVGDFFFFGLFITFILIYTLLFMKVVGVSDKEKNIIRELIRERIPI